MEVLKLAVKVLSFRATKEELSKIGPAHLLLGVVMTWLVGMGRWWDDPEALPTQKSGAGSVIYIFVLGTVLWLFCRPIFRENSKWIQMVGFIGLTAPPAALYAIPVERFTDLHTAGSINYTFLGIVAIYRVALMLWYLCKIHSIGVWAAASVIGLPITAMLSILFATGLMNAIANVMSNIREIHSSEFAGFGEAIFTIGCGAIVLLPVFGFSYIKAWRDAQ
ncbi:MAG: hypothetical protein KF784_15025 [Fimbriimonadaceae bacterium]|nr:hypothetical protein [Fimbriimonadaceae bacterium]